MVRKKMQTEEAATSVLVFGLIGIGGWQLGTAKNFALLWLGWALIGVGIGLSLLMGIFVLKGYKTKTWTQI